MGSWTGKNELLKPPQFICFAAKPTHTTLIISLEYIPISRRLLIQMIYVYAYPDLTGGSHF